MRFDGTFRAARWVEQKAIRTIQHLPLESQRKVRGNFLFRAAQSAWNRLRGSLREPDVLAPAPLCVLPWIHAHIETNGDVQLCCVARSAHGQIGNVHRQSITQIFHSEEMNAIRGQILAGVWPQDCVACRNRESMGVRSYRQSSNEKYFSHVQELSSKRDNAVPKIRTIDIRLNNICNFKCRSCNGFASNRWFNEHNHIYPDHTISVKYQGFDKLQTFWQDFDDHILADLESVHMAGGEPLLADAHYQLLEKLIAAGKTSVELQYDTNLSQLRFKHWDVVELWRKFPNLQISFSLDGTGEKGEYIREGLDFQIWIENVRRIQRELPHATRSLHFVVSILNVLDLPSHYAEIVAGQFVDPERITFTFLEWPSFLNAQVLRPDIKNRAQADLRDWLARDRDLPQAVRNQMNALITFLSEKDLYPIYGEEFASKTRYLDSSRGQDTAKLFTSLVPMLSHQSAPVISGEASADR